MIRSPWSVIGERLPQIGNAIADYFQTKNQQELQLNAQAALQNQNSLAKTLAELRDLRADPDLIDEEQLRMLDAQIEALMPLVYQQIDLTDLAAITSFNNSYQNLLTNGIEITPAMDGQAPVVANVFTVLDQARRFEQEGTRARESTAASYQTMLQQVAGQPNISSEERMKILDTWLAGINLEYLTPDQLQTIQAMGQFEDVTAIAQRQATLRNTEIAAERGEVGLESDKFNLEVARFEFDTFKERVAREFSQDDYNAIMNAVRTGNIGTLTAEQKQMYAEYLGVEVDSPEFRQRHTEQAALFQSAQNAELSAAALAEDAALLGIQIDQERLTAARLQTDITTYEYGRRQVSDAISDSVDIAKEIDAALVAGDVNTINAYLRMLENPALNPGGAERVRAAGFTVDELRGYKVMASSQRNRNFSDAATRSAVISAQLESVIMGNQRTLLSLADNYADVETFDTDVANGFYRRYEQWEIDAIRNRVVYNQNVIKEDAAAKEFDLLLQNPPLVDPNNPNAATIKAEWEADFVAAATMAGVSDSAARAIAKSVMTRGDLDLANVLGQISLTQARINAEGLTEATALSISEQLRLLADEESLTQDAQISNYCISPSSISQIRANITQEALSEYATNYNTAISNPDNRQACASLSARLSEISSFRLSLDNTFNIDALPYRDADGVWRDSNGNPITDWNNFSAPGLSRNSDVPPPDQPGGLFSGEDTAPPASSFLEGYEGPITAADANAFLNADTSSPQANQQRTNVLVQKYGQQAVLDFIAYLRGGQPLFPSGGAGE